MGKGGLGGFVVLVVLAVTGAHAPATVNGVPVGHAGVLYLTAGDTLRLGTPESGLRSYVAARMLAGHGFAGVSHLAGDLRFYDIVTGDARLIERATPCGAEELTATGPQHGRLSRSASPAFLG